ncbi:MAG: dihydrodipicolinate synthase family protein [Rhodoferax sp.]|nr:dihydrodipicolinate synthase family protein [Rhodoferax sp.]
MNAEISGLWPALLMPVDANGTLDSPRALAHVQRLLAAGCDGVTLFGTTGEGPAFTLTERKELLERMLGSGVRADQIIVTTTALALGDAIELGRHASRLGVHRQMFMPPFFFNQPRDAGVIEAVSQVIRGIGDDGLKLLLYHFPVMSTYGFSQDAVRALVQRFPGQVVGAKDSSCDLAHSLEWARAFPELSILVGAEHHIAEVMLVGGSGSINGLANVAPRLLARVIKAPAEVSAADRQLILDLLALLGVRPDMPFVGVYKMMLAEQLGDPQWLNMRAPLSPLQPEEAQAVRAGYHALGARLGSI